MTKWNGAFVLSSGRCGSTMVSTMLREHPELLSVSELLTSLDAGPLLMQPECGRDFFLERLSRLSADLRDQLQAAHVPELDSRQLRALGALHSVSPLLLATLPHLTNVPEAQLSELLTDLCLPDRAAPGHYLSLLIERLALGFGRYRWIERSGGSLEYAERIAACWPCAKLVVLLRDGRETAVSMSRHPMFRIRVARLLSRDGQLAPHSALRCETPVDRFGAYWSALMLRLSTLASGSAGRRMLFLSYEELVHRPEEALRRLARFLIDEPPPTAWLARCAQLPKVVASAWVELMSQEREALDRACRPGMRVMQRLLGREASGLELNEAR